MSAERDMNERITVNGESRAYEGQTVRDVIAAFGLDPDRSGIAVAVNASVTPRAEWAATRLSPGDRVEIVEAKAGG